ncbi:MAG: 6,7-dimethyl-8-ribityllumazine synthase [Flavobacteriales bacterium]|nr:6,7-dimethyl-8-ribityllumazine synthase [Flavobacteriales bacterium]MCC6939897.1 6,7-dimethyl-8-ribityllumazine synthase [Flavobacteriales bacterium]
MSTADHHLSHYDPSGVPSGAGRRFALVVSEWNMEVSDALRKAARETLLMHGVAEADLIERWVPGSFELAAGAQFLLERGGLHGVICLGSIVRGETPHFDYVCHGTTQGIMSVGLKFSVPVIFGVLTDDTLQQAKDRSGGKHGNKGVDCAVAVLKMAELRDRG